MMHESKNEAPEYREAKATRTPGTVPEVMATQAVRTGRVRYILAISLALVVVLMVIAYLAAV
jgi:hypothetical protein